LSWWDTQANQVREAVVAARTIDVLPAPGSSQSSSQAAAPTEDNTTASSPATNASNTSATQAAAPAQTRRPAATSNPWPWISLALGLLWVGTLIAWLTSRKRPGPAQPVPRTGSPTPTVDASRARSAFQAACRANDALAARRNLISWANARSPGAQIAGLTALAKQIEDSNTVALLRELDRACYAGGTWDSTALAAALQELNLGQRDAAARKPALAPLYQ
jgi:hypothetical protein